MHVEMAKLKETWKWLSLAWMVWCFGSGRVRGFRDHRNVLFLKRSDRFRYTVLFNS